MPATQFPWRLSDAPASAYPAGHQPPELRGRRAGLRRDVPQLGRPARRLVRRPDERLGLRQGRPDDARLPEPRPTSRSTTPSPTPTPLATRTTARCSARPARTAPTCGVARSTRSRSTATSSPTAAATSSARTCCGSHTPRRCRRPASAGRSTSARTTTATTAWSTSRHSPSTTRRRAARRLPATSSTTTAWPTSPNRSTRHHGQRRQPGQCRSRPTCWPAELPQVSWVVTNQAFSEHPDGAPNDGAYYVNGVLQALNADPDVFNSTLVIINYDENDGQFDHVPPPVARARARRTSSTPRRPARSPAYGVTQPLPVGLGFRVPLILISPWTRGGWVTSEVSDHTSVIQFLEKWTEALGTPAMSPNISAWRRSVCGDLTGAFDFDSPGFRPARPARHRASSATRPAAPTPAGHHQRDAGPGIRPKRARPLPYQPNANLDGFTVGRRSGHGATCRSATTGRTSARPAISRSTTTPPRPRSLADYPAKLPGQYTVDPSPLGTGPCLVRSTSATAGTT